MDDLEEFIKKYAKDPEKAFRHIEELRGFMHEHTKPKGLRPPGGAGINAGGLNNLLAEIRELRKGQEELRRKIEGLKRTPEELVSLLKAG